MRERVKTCRLFRQKDGIAQRRQQHRRHQANALCHPRAGCQRHQRLIVGIDQAVNNTQAGERTGLRQFCPLKQALAGYIGDIRREADTNLHT